MNNMPYHDLQKHKLSVGPFLLRMFMNSSYTLVFAKILLGSGRQA